MNTNKIDLIKAEVVKLKSNLVYGACSSQIAMETMCKEEAYNEVLAILDTMQEEPVSDTQSPVIFYGLTGSVGGAKEEPINEDLEKASKEWLAPQLDNSYADYGEAKMMELTRFDGYAMLDAIEFGAKWQKEQMMAKAIDGEVTYGKSLAIPSLGWVLDKEGLDYGDKVKLIIIKED